MSNDKKDINSQKASRLYDETWKEDMQRDADAYYESQEEEKIMASGTNERIIENIKEYIRVNNLSLPKIAEAAGLEYFKLYQLLNRNKTIRLDDYISLCRAFKEPFDKFLPK